MGSAVDGVDVVDERESRLVVAVVVLEGDLDVRRVPLGVQRNGGFEQHVRALVEVLDELHDSAGVMIGLGEAIAFVLEADRDAGVEEGEFLQPAGHRLLVEGGGFHDRPVRLEPCVRTRRIRRANDLEGGDGSAPLVALKVLVTVSEDPYLEPFGEGVHDVDSDPVQPARHLVGVPVELGARVEDRHDDLERRSVVLRVDLDGDATTVVPDRARSIFVEGDRDLGTGPREDLVDRVVDDLVDELVQAARVGRPDIHSGASTDRGKTLEDLDGTGIVHGAVHGLLYHRKSGRKMAQN